MLRLSRGGSACGGRTWSLTVEIEVEFQHVYNWLTEKAKLSPFRVRRNDLSQLVFSHAAFARDARNLKFRCGGRDVWVESGAGSRHQIDRHRLTRILGL